MSIMVREKEAEILRPLRTSREMSLVVGPKFSENIIKVSILNILFLYFTDY